MLTDDEKELGVCLVDIGGGTTDIAIFTNGAIQHSAVIPIAGDQVTNDIAIALRTPTKCAEEIKLQHACALANLTNDDVVIEVPGTVQKQKRETSQKALTHVVEARYEELFALVRTELRRSGFDDLIASGVVLTGGASKVNGVVELAEQVFQLPVRLGSPQNIGGMVEVTNNPIYATGVGLLLTGYQHYQQGKGGTITLGEHKNLWTKMKNWFQGNF